ncbi:methylmalonyl-CoA mutase family protein [Dyadobacter sp. CY345]|uniref:methylmalonyl-CoA mutase family protein n=1 Tax=Dyadobacter sp. CY345 TaxID=2909335 RepID=UPI001F3DCFB7|nr:methylmalonyl-CoA mutase family protein [Dyadobacter sp. CY345]MCF2447495.1 methylmalonyl-CoA mutase family protein [Dyadobacter sp. CY345]
MSPSLFSEFEFCDKNAWKKQAENELAGKYEKINNFKIAPDLTLEAYYSANDLNPEQISALQNCQKKIPGWLNTPLIKFDNPRTTNNKITFALNAGADAVLLHLTEPDLFKNELSKTLYAVKLCDTPIFFKTEINSEKIFEEVSRGAGYYMKGGIANDPLANWMRNGSAFSEPVKNVCATLNKTKMMREFRPLMVESHVYHNAGANPVQELAFLLASTVYYLDKLTDAGISPLHALNRFFYSISIGPEYLTEIAKLRALRYLHKKIGMAYQVPPELCNTFIQAQTSTFYNAKYDLKTNIVRSTSEAMSAVIGGCDALTVLPYNQSFEETTEFSERVARNVSSLLSAESYLDRVADPAAGSYQLETMTIKMADAAWELFLETEEKGGIIPCFETGFIQKEIDKSWQQKQEELQKDKIFVGVNKYRTEKTTDIPNKPDSPETSNSEEIKWLVPKNLSEHW